MISSLQKDGSSAPSLLKQIICRYESCEEDFLRELESMQRRNRRHRANSVSTTCINKNKLQSSIGSSNINNTVTSNDDDTNDNVLDTSEDEGLNDDDVPVLGTLCTLVSEISELRRENRKLLRRFVRSASDSTRQERDSTQFCKEVDGFRRQSSCSSSSATSFSRSFFSLSSASSEAVGRVGAFLSAKARIGSSTGTSSFRSRGSNSALLLPKFISSGGKLLSGGTSASSFGESQFRASFNNMPYRRKMHGGGVTPIKYGAPEQLSAPPKDLLTASAYSADLSSDTLSSYHPTAPRISYDQSALSTIRLTPSPNPSNDDASFTCKSLAPPGVSNNNNKMELPCKSDSDLEINCDTPDVRTSRRFMIRRASAWPDQIISSSSASASSSADQMNTSRSSFLEFIGLRPRKKSTSSKTISANDDNANQQQDIAAKNAQTFRISSAAKKRKHRISENDTYNKSLPSLEHEMTPTAHPHHCLYQQRRRSAIYFNEDHPSDPSETAAPSSWCDFDMPMKAQNNNNSTKEPLYDKNAIVRQSSRLRRRPTSLVCPTEAISPTTAASKPRLKFTLLKSKTNSCRSVYEDRCANMSITTFNELTGDTAQFARIALTRQRETLAMQHNEICALETRNIRLIEQLRKKSARQSLLQVKNAQLQVELDCLRNSMEFDAHVKRCSVALNEHVGACVARTFSTVATDMRKLEAKLHKIKESQAHEQKAIMKKTNQESIWRNVCLKRVERLQRDNFTLMQQLANGDNTVIERGLRYCIDRLPSYDALYTFTIGLMEKLSHMREKLTEKLTCDRLTQVEIAQTQATLLVANIEIKRLHSENIVLQSNLYNSSKYSSPEQGQLLRSASMPSIQSMNEKICASLQVQAARVSAQLRTALKALDSLDVEEDVESRIEENELEIETQFLDFFDDARALSEICNVNNTIANGKALQNGCITYGDKSFSCQIPSCSNNKPVEAPTTGNSPSSSPLANARRKFAALRAAASVASGCGASKSAQNSPVLNAARRFKNGLPAVPTSAKDRQIRRPLSWIHFRESNQQVQRCEDEFDFRKTELTLLNSAQFKECSGNGESAPSTPILIRRTPLFGGVCRVESEKWSPSPNTSSPSANNISPIGKECRFGERRIMHSVVPVNAPPYNFINDKGFTNVLIQRLYDTPPTASSHAHDSEGANISAWSSVASSSDYNTIDENIINGAQLPRNETSIFSRALNVVNVNNNTGKTSERQQRQESTESKCREREIKIKNPNTPKQPQKEQQNIANPTPSAPPINSLLEEEHRQKQQYQQILRQRKLITQHEQNLQKEELKVRREQQQQQKASGSIRLTRPSLHSKLPQKVSRSQSRPTTSRNTGNHTKNNNKKCEDKGEMRLSYDNSSQWRRPISKPTHNTCINTSISSPEVASRRSNSSPQKPLQRNLLNLVTLSAHNLHTENKNHQEQQQQQNQWKDRSQPQQNRPSSTVNASNWCRLPPPPPMLKINDDKCHGTRNANDIAPLNIPTTSNQFDWTRNIDANERLRSRINNGDNEERRSRLPMRATFISQSYVKCQNNKHNGNSNNNDNAMKIASTPNGCDNNLNGVLRQENSADVLKAARSAGQSWLSRLRRLNQRHTSSEHYKSTAD